MVIIIMGAPGAGKGTQAALLADKINIRTLSTGDALRRQVKLQTEVGKKAGELMNRGELVPDDILLEILNSEIGTNPADHVLLDGYPRNINQAKTLDTLDLKVGGAVLLEVDSEELVSRLSGRRVCGKCGASYHVTANPPVNGKCSQCGSDELIQRPDDKIESVRHRLNVYEESTKPVCDYYRDQGKYNEVSGLGSLEEINTRLVAVVSSMLDAG